MLFQINCLSFQLYFLSNDLTVTTFDTNVQFTVTLKLFGHLICSGV